MQKIIVGIIVAFAAWSVMKRYAPQSARQFCRAWAARIAKRLGWLTLERRIEASAQADASCSDGCGACKGCGPVADVTEKSSSVTLDDLKRTLQR